MKSDLNRLLLTIVALMLLGASESSFAAKFHDGKNQGGIWSDLGVKYSRALQAGDLALAEDYARKRVELANSIGPDRRVGNAYRNLATVLRKRGNLEETEALIRKAQPFIDRGNGKLSHQAVKNLHQLIAVLIGTARYAEAKTVALEALERQLAYAPHHNDLLLIYNQLASVELRLKRYDEAESWLDKAVKAEISPEPVDEDDNTKGTYWVSQRRAHTLVIYAQLEMARGSLDKAGSHIGQAIEMFRSIGNENHPDLIRAMIPYASILLREEKYKEAEIILTQVVKASERNIGASNPETATALFKLAQAIAKQGRASEAEPLFDRAVKIVKQQGVLEKFAHFGQGKVRFMNHQSKPLEGVGLEREVLDAVDKLFAQTRGLDEASREGYISQFGSYYLEAVGLMLELNKVYPANGYDKEALTIVSRTQSRIFSELLRQADVSGLSGVKAFANLYEQQVKLNKKLDELRRAKSLALRKNYVANENGDEEQEGAVRKVNDAIVQARIDAAAENLRKETLDTSSELAVVEAALWEKFPRYMELAQPRPVTVELLQKKLLKPNEKLVTYFLLPDRALAFIVSRDDYQMIEMPVTREEVAAMVVAARAPEESVGREGFAGLNTLDPSLLNKLYTSLFQPLEPYLQDSRRVLVIADGPLYNLPLEMLVTRYGEKEQTAFETARTAHQIAFAEYGSLPYLGEKYRFAYLPSLSALASMRLYHKPQVKYERDFVSFADPVFERKADSSPLLDVLTRGMRKGGSLTIPRLPETGVEAKEISAIVGGKSEIFLREDAQEYTAKTMDLKYTKYIHFATHGLLAGEFADLKNAYATAESESVSASRQRSLVRVKSAESPAVEDDEMASTSAEGETIKGEPALLLSLAGNMHGEDGLLTMREILSKLDLNAKLVVLSACNTAGEGTEANNGEGFAGLTRSFMYAGAQGLLVSHWSVESQATQDLMTNTFRYLQARPDTLEAVNQAREKIRKSTATYNGRTVSRAHPYFWAPFVFVGE